MIPFYYDYKGQQVLNVDPTTLVQTLINVTKSRIAGGERELAPDTRETCDSTLVSECWTHKYWMAF